jgi:hypothetical protein
MSPPRGTSVPTDSYPGEAARGLRPKMGLASSPLSSTSLSATTDESTIFLASQSFAAAATRSQEGLSKGRTRPRKLASQMVLRAPKGRSKVTNGAQLFIDGDARLKVSRRFRDVLASIATDLGGADRLSEARNKSRAAAPCSLLNARSWRAPQSPASRSILAFMVSSRIGLVAPFSGLASNGSCTT